MTSTNTNYNNALVNESSPYLLQHAHNPVNWFPWNTETLLKAKAENKLILISIGYSACHWCHVMAHECFEDEETAALMNQYFINVKVDREERPDVDAVYMHAVQLMTGRGGWPLNCIALPDGRPIYGGTYFPRLQWKEVLKQIGNFYARDKNKCIEYANEITLAINKPEKLVQSAKTETLSVTVADRVYDNWKQHFDLVEGGPDRSPKFPLPNNFEFLLRYAHQTNNAECQNYVLLSLDKMAYGGINDQLGGGFARYSTDSFWKVPHFEKMLYDNAQLVSLYAQAWQLTKRELYKEVVYETLGFIDREMTTAEGAFYSALDADSEGEEGKFYVWKKEELNLLSEPGRSIFEDYYNINEKGFWEHGNYILLRTETDETVAKKHNLNTLQFKQLIGECKKILMAEREKRTRPGLDDKILVSWNALMIKGYVDAFKAFAEQKFLEAALRNANFILKKCTADSGALFHSFKNGKAMINGYLEDYCFTMEAFLALFEISGQMEHLLYAKQLMDYCFKNFRDHESGFFFFTSAHDEPLISRKKEIEDNVIPSSNSSLAKALFVLGKYFPESDYAKDSLLMVSSIKEQIVRFGSSYSNWGLLLLHTVYPFLEIAVIGKDAEKMSENINSHYLPNKILFYSTTQSDFSLFKDRYVENKTLVYVCENQSCKLPVDNSEKVLKLIQSF